MLALNWSHVALTWKIYCFENSRFWPLKCHTIFNWIYNLITITNSTMIKCKLTLISLIFQIIRIFSSQCHMWLTKRHHRLFRSISNEIWSQWYNWWQTSNFRCLIEVFKIQISILHLVKPQQKRHGERLEPFFVLLLEKLQLDP